MTLMTDVDNLVDTVDYSAHAQ